MKINHNYEIKKLARYDDYSDVWSSEYFQKYFVARYINDLPRFAFEVVGIELTHQQIEVWNEYKASGGFKGGRLGVASGHGCHGIDTPILMSNGKVKKIQDIKVGEYLMGDDGKSKRKVLDLARGKEELFEFKFNDGSTKIYNKSHILVLVASQTHGKQKKGDITKVKIGDWVNWSDRKKRTHCIYKSKALYKEKTLPIEPYFLGLWLGDGHSCSNTITNIDEEVIKYIYSYAKQNNYRVAKQDAISYALRGKKNNTQTKISRLLRELELKNNKHIPYVYLTSSIKQRLELLAGLIDTDGSLDARGKRVYEITQKNKRLALDIVSLARSCGLHATIKEVSKSCKYKGEVKKGVYQLINITRNVEIIPCKIHRKKAIKCDKPQRTNLHFGIKSYKSLGVGNYFGFAVNGNNLYLDGDYIVTSNTGKTKFIGIIVILHLLCFKQSITRVQAPTLAQVTSSSFKEATECCIALKRGIKIENKTFSSKWGFLLKFIQINIASIYIKGYKTSWYIEAKGSPKADPVNLAGQHQFNYLLIFDEASGINDSAFAVSQGAVTETYNSIIAFSQHTRLNGAFHEIMTINSKDRGGVWHTLRLSSRKSARLGKEQLKKLLSSYSEDEIRVRIDGLPPKHESGKLISSELAYGAYESVGNLDKDKYNKIAFSYDLGYTGYRDSSILIASDIYSFIELETDRAKTYYDVNKIWNYEGLNGKLPLDFIDEVFKNILVYLREKAQNNIFYDEIYVIGDATAGGYEPFKKLEEKFLNLAEFDIIFKGLQWGSERLYFDDKKRFINARAKGYVNLKEALDANRFKVSTDEHRNKCLFQMANIMFKFTDTFKYKMFSKEDMKRMGISSPDIADCFAQLMLINLNVSDYETAESMQDIDEDIENYIEDGIVELEILDEDIDDEYNEYANDVNDTTINNSVITSISLDDEF